MKLNRIFFSLKEKVFYFNFVMNLNKPYRTYLLLDFESLVKESFNYNELQPVIYLKSFEDLIIN